MILEYLIFNGLILSGPIVFSFDHKVRYINHWKTSLLSALIVAVPFIAWDIWATDRHWWFHPERTLPTRLFGLPAGEWLFFLSIPFACLFIWQILKVRNGYPLNIALCGFYRIWPLMIGFAILLFIQGKEYTGLTCASCGLAILLDYLLKTHILMHRDCIVYFGIITGLMLVFNGYLTARPIVLYNPAYQLNFRVFSIPLEDFFYGYSLILMNTSVFEKLKGRT